MSKDTFTDYHPIVNLLFFVSAIGFTMFFMHPVCLALSLLSSLSYNIYINPVKAVRFNLFFMLPVLLLTALLNPLFNHQGITMLAYLPNGNPITLESIVYGIASAIMLITVISWFSCLNSVMTSDKFVYLFGRIIPALSLVLSMSLRFIPRFIKQIKVVANAQTCIGRDESGGKILGKVKHGLRIISILVTWALENAIETADSMKGRGYGLPGRTAFSIFKFKRRDVYATIYILACASAIIAGTISGAYQYRYYPSIRGQWSGTGTIVLYMFYLALCLLPIIVNIKEDIVWKSIASKI